MEILDPIRLVSTADPHPAYAALRERKPVDYVPERDLWVLSRHAHVSAALRDPETYVSGHGIVPSGYIPETPTIIVLDGEPHARMRRAVQRAFTPRRIDALADRIRSFARRLADDLDDGDVDVFARYTDPLPLLVMAELLGVDPSERAMFKRCGDAIVFASGREPAALVAGQKELTEYLSGVFAERRRTPRDDLISVLLHGSPEGDALGDEELLALCFVLLVAGTETATGALGNALLLLDRDRDPRVFPDPDRFDIARSPNPHVSFGFGVHFCLGASLARMELGIGLEELLRRAPRYAVDTAGVVRLRSDTNRDFERLPITIGAAQ